MTLRDALPLGIFALAYLVLARGNLPPLRLDRAGAAAANAGSVATITGNPQNMIVPGFAELDYLHFAARLAPVAALGLVVNYAVLALLYRRHLAPRPLPLLPPRPRHLPWPLRL